MKNEKHNVQEMQTNQEVQNPNIINLKITKPIQINGKETNELVLDFTDLTGKDILKIDMELRMNNRPGGFDSIYNQDALLMLAARGIGCVPDDLEALHGVEFFELLMQVRNFFIQW